ncbi:ribosomal protein S18-alanine N-acetyltransferase [Parvularcula flava]|uniref:[Ribosomal protein bS18]-alanine N-acetyltransferase n=1 Tax=Aquisalinus luteolus TaxID=1566827 RepID=A0A8J3EQY6_9PROT|nr:ribosomal protein S18-alanine N-acetyltransferase [Aquisalinus luteolus]NHK28023.1 ribosomal protein S18-alanine N-acetyltransferase [Aquisalinus luteolus]GGH97233.1 N-acetyltransferase GCN5 [Aquisalinus luteolus]
MSGQTISCSLAGPTHADLLARLHAEIFVSEPWDANWFGRMLLNPAVSGLILSRDDEPTGLALTSAVADEAEILTIGILPACRRQGLGGALLEAVIGDAAGRGVTRLHLEVSADNHAAIALYEKAGFARTGLRRKYYRNGADAVMMAHELRPPAL